MNKVRWGLLSTANINRALIPALRASRRGELVGVASRDAGKAAAYAQQWQISHAFGSYEAMLDSGLVDAVYISLPNHLHAEWSVYALRRGVHVLCEKPLAITLAQIEEMMAASRESGCVLAEAFMYRHHPQTKIVGDWVRAGHLGEISLVRGSFDFAIRSRHNIRLTPQWGGGCLWDVDVYPLSFAQFIMGEPPLSVAGSQWVGSSGVDETFVGQMRYTGDRLAQIAAAFRTPFYTVAEVIGTEGRLHLNRPFTQVHDDRRLLFFPKDGEPQEIAVPDKMLYLGEVEDMHAAILDGAPPYLTLDESRHHVRTVLALYESARQNQIVTLAQQV